MDRTAASRDGDPRAARQAGDGEMRRLRRLVIATAVTTFVLIMVGGAVRVSDSGLGCGPAGSGTEGWPLCDGRVVPLIDEKTLIEFSHRFLASVVLVLIVVVVWRARKAAGRGSLVRRAAYAALGLVLAQAALGGLTVENNLDEVLVASHLGLAMLLLATLVGLAWASAQPDRPPPARATGGMRALALAATALVLATIVAGGYVAGTEQEGVRGGVANGAHLACGTEFPGCLGGVLPFGRHGHLVDVQLTHRALVYTTTAVVLALLGLALWRRLFDRNLAILAAALAIQLTLGALNIWLGKESGLILAHLAVGTALWTAMVSATLRMQAVPSPEPRRSISEPETSAVPA